MDYDLLIRRSWFMTWRVRWLWVLGLFLPSGGGGASGGGGGGTPDPQTASVGAGGASQAADWIAQNGPALLAVGLAAVALLLLVILALLIVSFIAQGGMVWATAAVARDEPATLGAAWRAGLRYAWRYVGLWLLQLGLVLLVVLAIGLGLVLIGLSSEAGRVVAVVIGLTLILPVIGLVIAFSVVVSYAVRAIVLEDAGPWSALKFGVGLLYANLGTSVLTWLISLGLGIAAGFLVLIVLAVVVGPLALVGVGWYSAAGFSAGLIAFIVLAVVLTIAVMWGVGAILNTYFWSYWTLAYLSLTGRLRPAVAAV
jgi:hypothetical protein